MASRYSHRSRMSPVRESCIIIISSQMSIRNAAAVFGLCDWLRYAFAAASATAFGATPACPGVHRNIAYPLILCVAVGGGAVGGLRILCCGYLRCVALVVDMRVQLRLVPTYPIVLGIGMLCCFQSRCLHSSGGMCVYCRELRIHDLPTVG